MKRENAIAVAIIAAVSIALMYRQLITHAVFSAVVDDTVIYLNWTRQFMESFKEGVLYPRWMPDANGGYGSPTFIFYSPLAIFLAALLDLAIKDMIFSVNLIKLGGLFLSGVFMYMFIKDIRGWKAGLVSAAVYMALPYRVFELYILGLYSSRLAFVWFPLALYFTRKAVMEERLGKNTALFAVSYSLLCITHLVSAYMLTPVILGFGLITAGKHRIMPAASRLAAMLMLGLALAGFYLLPVIFERGLVHFQAMLRLWWSDYQNVFLGYISSGAARIQPSFYEYLKESIIASVLFGVLFYLYSRSSKENARSPEAAFFLGITMASVLMMTSVSRPLWEVVPGMKLLAFPSRWASITTLGISCMAGAGFNYTEKGAKNGPKRLLKYVMGLLLGVASLYALYYDANIIKQNQTLAMRDIARFPTDADLPEYVPENVSFDWLNKNLYRPPAERVAAATPGFPVAADIKNWGAENRSFTVRASSDAPLRVRTFYYPGWKGYVDGKSVGLSSEKNSGAILLNVPQGEHQVSLTFSDTPDRTWGKVLSALAAAFVLYIFVRSRKNTATIDGKNPGIAS